MTLLADDGAIGADTCGASEGCIRLSTAEPYWKHVTPDLQPASTQRLSHRPFRSADPINPRPAVQRAEILRLGNLSRTFNPLFSQAMDKPFKREDPKEQSSVDILSPDEYQISDGHERPRNPPDLLGEEQEGREEHGYRDDDRQIEFRKTAFDHQRLGNRRKGHDGQNVEDIRSDDTADDHVGMVLPCGRHTSGKFRQRRPERDHGHSDDRFGHTQGDTTRNRALNEYFR